MRFPKKVTARATALTLALGLVGVLVTALPAFAAVPTVTSLTPSSGPPGTAVQIAGTGFISSGTTTAVTFNGVAASSFIVNSDILITAVAPCSTTGNVHVTTTGGVDTNTNSFTYTAASAPTITSFAPTSGPVGTSVIITGTNFCGATTVLFNATAATTKTVNSSTQITALVPTGATTGPIHVTVPTFLTANSTASFTVAGVPTITSFSPTIGNVGTIVSIIGTNLLGVSAVKFNGVTAAFTTSTATSVSATVPTGATTGKIQVTTPGGTATSATDFTVTTAPVARTVTFGFEQHSRVSGQVTVSNGIAACRSFVPVVIQKLKNGSWKWVDTTATTASGSYKTYIPPSNGHFRAKAIQITLVNGVVCGGDISNVVHS